MHGKKEALKLKNKKKLILKMIKFFGILNIWKIIKLVLLKS
jgi:IS4 transposase